MIEDTLGLCVDQLDIALGHLLVKIVIQMEGVDGTVCVDRMSGLRAVALETEVGPLFTPVPRARKAAGARHMQPSLKNGSCGADGLLVAHNMACWLERMSKSDTDPRFLHVDLCSGEVHICAL